MGYYARPAERNKGYAKEILRQNLQNCKDLNIGKVLITYDQDNLANKKTIIASSGIFEKKAGVDNCLIKRYWITIM